MCNYDHSAKLMIRFREEDHVFVTERDNYSDVWLLVQWMLGIWLDINLLSSY